MKPVVSGWFCPSALSVFLPPAGSHRLMLLAAALLGPLPGFAESVTLPAPPVVAADTDDVPEAVRADWAARRANAQATSAQASAQLEAAKAQLEQVRAACFEKFLVVRCQNEALERYLVEEAAARKLEIEAKTIERQVRGEELAAQDAKRQRTMQQRELEAEARAARTSAERARLAGEINARTARKEAEAVAGAKHRAEEAERLAKKRADHEKRVAEQIQKAAQRPAGQKKPGIANP